MPVLKICQNTMGIEFLIDFLLEEEDKDLTEELVLQWFKVCCNSDTEVFALQKACNAVELLCENGVSCGQKFWKEWLLIQKRCCMLLPFHILNEQAYLMGDKLAEIELRRMVMIYLELAIKNRKTDFAIAHLYLGQIYGICMYVRQEEDLIKNQMWFEEMVLVSNLRFGRDVNFWKHWEEIYPKNAMSLHSCFLGLQICCVKEEYKKAITIYHLYEKNPHYKITKKEEKLESWVIDLIDNCEALDSMTKDDEATSEEVETDWELAWKLWCDKCSKEGTKNAIKSVDWGVCELFCL